MPLLEKNDTVSKTRYSGTKLMIVLGAIIGLLILLFLLLRKPVSDLISRTVDTQSNEEVKTLAEYVVEYKEGEIESGVPVINVSGDIIYEQVELQETPETGGGEDAVDYWVNVTGDKMTGTLEFQDVVEDIKANSGDVLNLLATGSGNILIDPDQGNVGVGVDSPEAKLEVGGGIKIGNSTVLVEGTMRWTGSDFEGYDGSDWVSLTGGLVYDQWVNTTGDTMIGDLIMNGADINLGSNSLIVGLGISIEYSEIEILDNGISISETTGTVPINRGGTNATSFIANQFVWYNGTSLVASGYGPGSFMGAGTDLWVNTTGDTMSGTLIFSGVTNDITVAADEAFTIIAPGSGHIVLDAGTGNVGVGTTSPNASLEVTNQNSGQSSLLVNQSQDYWTRVIGGADDEIAYDVEITPDGGYIVAGEAWEISGSGSRDMYFVKFNSSGGLDNNFGTGGTLAIGGNTVDGAKNIELTSDGGYIATGYTTSYGEGEWDLYVVKFDSQGNLDQSFNGTGTLTLGGIDDEEGHDIEQTEDGGYIVVGETYGSGFGPGSTDVYLAKLTPSGSLDTNFGTGGTVTVGGSGHDYGYAVEQTSDGGYIVAGYSTSFDPNPGVGNVYVLKFDSTGNLDNRFGTNGTLIVGGTSWEMGSDVKQTSDGGYIVVGQGRDGSGDDYDFYIIKLTSEGALDNSFGTGGIFAIGGSGFYVAESVEETSDGGYIVAGYRYASRIYIIKLDRNGSLDMSFGGTGVIYIGGPAREDGYSIKQTHDGGFVVAGLTTSYGAGGFDYYVAKFDGSGNIAGCSDISSGTGVLKSWGSTGSGGTTGSGGVLGSGGSTSFGGTLEVGCDASSINRVFEISNSGNANLYGTLVLEGDNYANQFYGSGINLSKFDLAEDYKVVDETISAGDVVAISKGSESHIEKTQKVYDGKVIGVVSTEPGIQLSDWSLSEEERKTMRPVALAGRVPVKVTTENGNIEKGDYLVPANKVGYAMKACGEKYCKWGTVIGTALESFSLSQEGDTTEVTSKLAESTQEVKGAISIDGNADIQQLVEDLNEPLDLAETRAGEGRIMMFINLMWYDPRLDVISTGDEESVEIADEDTIKKEAIVIDNGGVETYEGLIVTGKAEFSEVKISKSLEIIGNLSVQGNIEFLSDSRVIFRLGDMLGNNSFEIQNVEGNTVFAVDSKGNVIKGGADISYFNNSAGRKLEPGEVVVIDSESARSVKLTNKKGDEKVIGIVVQGGETGEKVGVAVSGEISVYYSGDVFVGDILVSSTQKGKAENSENPSSGTILGKVTHVDSSSMKATIILTLE